MTTLSDTRGGAMTSLEILTFHNALPSGSKASTSPLSLPATTIESLAPGPADSGWPALTRHTARPVAASSRVSVPSLAAAYIADVVSAGAMPGPAAPTLCCQLIRGVIVAVRFGIGPGFLPPPVNHANDGTGMSRSHDVSDESDMLAHPASSTAAMTVLL